uniref:Sushi domain-containing protein n=1 Tax=Pygocentrus nattereri TaxID=42514 RepID=A0AAR2L7T7_PYGNA
MYMMCYFININLIGNINEVLTLLFKITCDIPFGQHVSYPDYYFGGDRKLGVKKSFRCESGYVSQTGTATCTENGWIPNPLCTGKSLSVGGSMWLISFLISKQKNMKKSFACFSEIACPEPRIDHARQLDNPLQTYKPGARIRYQCLHLSRTFEITCDWLGKWKDMQSCPGPCTVDLKAMGDHHLQLRHTDTEKIYSTHGDVIEFSCKRGYRRGKDSVPFRQRCTNGHIDLPVCEYWKYHLQT